MPEGHPWARKWWPPCDNLGDARLRYPVFKDQESLTAIHLTMRTVSVPPRILAGNEPNAASVDPIIHRADRGLPLPNDKWLKNMSTIIFLSASSTKGVNGYSVRLEPPSIVTIPGILSPCSWPVVPGSAQWSQPWWDVANAKSKTSWASKSGNWIWSRGRDIELAGVLRKGAVRNDLALRRRGNSRVASTRGCRKAAGRRFRVDRVRNIRCGRSRQPCATWQQAAEC
jgi:hypothetical protein